MSIQITSSRIEDIEVIMSIFDSARRYMRANGNLTQWGDGYPSQDLIVGEILQGTLYSCICDGEVVGVFSFRIGIEPTYARIYKGCWRNEAPYGVIHRLASNGKCRGISAACISWCRNKISHLRADTHADNKIMQQVLLQQGFEPCGIVIVHNGTERIAYEYVGDS